MHSEHRTSEPAWSEGCPAGHTVRVMEGYSELRTGLGGQRNEDVHVPGPSWDWQEHVPLQHSCPGMSRSRGHPETTPVIISTFNLYTQSPQEAKKGEKQHTEDRRGVLSQPGSSLPGLTSVPEGSGREASSSMQKIMVATGGAAQGQTSPSKAAAAIYISERQSKERG